MWELKGSDEPRNDSTMWQLKRGDKEAVNDSALSHQQLFGLRPNRISTKNNADNSLHDILETMTAFIQNVIDSQIHALQVAKAEFFKIAGQITQDSFSKRGPLSQFSTPLQRQPRHHKETRHQQSSHPLNHHQPLSNSPFSSSELSEESPQFEKYVIDKTKRKLISQHEDEDISLFEEERTTISRQQPLEFTHGTAVRGIAVTSNGNIVSFSDGNLGSIKVWNLSDTKAVCVRTIQQPHIGSMYCMIALGDGKLVSGGSDMVAKVWELSSGNCTRELRGHTSSIFSLAELSHRRLATGSEDGCVKIWTLNNSRCVLTLEQHDIALNPKTIRENDRSVNCLVCLSNHFLASGSADGKIKIWDPLTGRCINILKGHTDCIQTMSLLQNGSLASGSFDGSIRVWDMQRGQCERAIANPQSDVQSIVSLELGKIASICGDSVYIWNWHSGHRTMQFLHDDGVNALCKIDNGILATGSSSGNIRIWKYKTNIPQNKNRRRIQQLSISNSLKDTQVLRKQISQKHKIKQYEPGEKYQ